MDASPSLNAGAHAEVGPWPAVMAGLLAAAVGYGSSFAIVLQGLIGAGASPGQAASGLLAVCVVMGLASIGFVLRLRMPISIAWSTPGAVLLAATGVVPGGFPAAVGAFLVVGVLIIAAGLWRPFGRAVLAIPGPIASAMLAGLLFGFCIAPFKALAAAPLLMLPIILVWVVVGRFARLYAATAAMAAAVAMVGLAAGGLVPSGTLGLKGVHLGGSLLPRLEWVTPVFSGSAVISIALPLFLVTMAAQNIPGLAVLRANGYHPPAGPLLVGTGIATLATAAWGGHTINLAAVTAALCAGPDAHPDPKRRWIAGLAAAIAYLALGLLSTTAMGFINAAPPLLIQAVAGLALFGAFGSSLGGFLAAAADRDAAVITFIATASGFALFGVGSAFWGLVTGGAVLALHRARRKS